ncbi:L-aminoadipate-semialdehyde dehydrogenase-phosphopantetheinyl transferase-like [Bacillus rossius redtenbacheri]|uniref:L-aminoadipate-semialdehyde dehydrogenase-phosphopantetheinyl transferase-like n=1 Tax=Bacillus rossius redtenbacheri TaxID=93214 RepID=UPI002FDC8BD8
MSIFAASPKSARWAFNAKTWQPTESQFLLASACIQEEEKARIGKFVFRNDVKASLVGRLLMRKYVSSTSGIPYSEVKFLRDEKGKPYALNSKVNFNVSHHGDYAVLAGEVATNRVGVDVMKLEYKTGRELEEFFSIMSLQFTSQEWGRIRGPVDTPAYKQVVMFNRHWCLKESYLKAVGLGISVDLNRVCMMIGDQDLCLGAVVKDTQVCFDGQHLKSWCFEETLLDEEHCVAVAVDKDSDESYIGTFQIFDFDHLMNGSSPLLELDAKYTHYYFGKCEKVSACSSSFH